MPFRLRAKNVLLTYPQLSQDALSQFTDRAEAHYEFVCQVAGTPLCYRAGRELHEDGGVHIHVFLSWENPCRTSNERLFDYGGAHPNILPVPRTPGKSWDYAGKDGDVIYELGSRPGETRVASVGRDGLWADALSLPTKTEFLDHLRAVAPRDYVLYFEAIERFADRFYTNPPPDYISPRFELLDSERVDDAVDQLRIGRGDGSRAKSLILWGPTRTGKTVFARSLGK